MLGHWFTLPLLIHDSTLGASGKTVEHIEDKLNLDIEKVDMCFESNKMSTHCDKTKVRLDIFSYAHNNIQKNWKMLILRNC